MDSAMALGPTVRRSEYLVFSLLLGNLGTVRASHFNTESDDINGTIIWFFTN